VADALCADLYESLQNIMAVFKIQGDAITV